MRRIAYFLIFAVLLAACAPASSESGESRVGAAPVPGRFAPDFPIDSPDLPGVAHLSDLGGKVVLVNFWASWCAYCRREMPVLESAYQKYQGQGLMVLGVNVEEDWGKIDKFRRDVKFSFPVTLDPSGEIFEAYWGRGIPNSFFISPDGTVKAVHYGEITEEQIEKILGDLGFTNP